MNHTKNNISELDVEVTLVWYPHVGPNVRPIPIYQLPTKKLHELAKDLANPKKVVVMLPKVPKEYKGLAPNYNRKEYRKALLAEITSRRTARNLIGRINIESTLEPGLKKIILKSGMFSFAELSKRKLTMLSKEEITQIHNAIHDYAVTSVTIQGVTHPIKTVEKHGLGKTQLVRSVFIDKMTWMEQNKLKNTSYAAAARMGSKITWGIKPRSTDSWAMIITRKNEDGTFKPTEIANY